MNLQEYITSQIAKTRKSRFSNSDQMSLGQMIDEFEKIVKNQKYRINAGDEEATVSYDFEYLFPTEIGSWRGSYAELALNWTTYSYKNNDKPLKVSEFLEVLKEAVGKTYTGYKGGYYEMSENTPVWVANYGNSGNTAVIDIVDNEYTIIIMTGYREF